MKNFSLASIVRGDKRIFWRLSKISLERGMTTECKTMVDKNIKKTVARKPFQLVYSSLRKGNSLSERDIELIRNSGHTLPQFASLGVQLALKKRNNLEEDVIKEILSISSELSEFLTPLVESKVYRSGSDKVSILTKLNKKVELSDLEMEKLFNQYDEGEISDSYMAIWLMIVCHRGLSERNVMKLTDLMKNSGKTFDYRNSPELGFRKIVRRYPTGALSEKTALIMPSLIASLSDKYPIASNFLVAKSLSYTGGTWDKLNSLPNFYFPQQGEETIEMMKRFPHVSMSVTREDFNPLDRKLYQLRSVTGTVESIPLIVSSIASKQLAMPADFLLMDVRYGKGAFLKSKNDAIEMSSLLMKILNCYINSDYVLINSMQPTGASVGNELEIVEAIKVMRDRNNEFNDVWDKRVLSEQKALVANMLAEIFYRVFPCRSLDYYKKDINCAFSEGRVLDSFKDLLRSHKVESIFVDKLVENPELLISKYSSFDVLSRKEGEIVSINQESLGMFVNFELQTGLNDYISPKKNGGGVILRKRIGDSVKVGEPLCVLLAHSDYVEENKNFLENYLIEVFNFKI